MTQRQRIATVRTATRRALERLRGSVSKIRSRGGKGQPERLLMIVGAGRGRRRDCSGSSSAGSALRARRTSSSRRPYLISGGLLGLAVAVVGGLFYFSYWITRQIQETRRQGDETAESLRQIRDLLASGAVSAAGASAKASATGNGSYVATEKGTMFHKPDCVVVAGRDDLRTRRARRRRLRALPDLRARSQYRPEPHRLRTTQGGRPWATFRRSRTSS